MTQAYNSAAGTPTRITASTSSQTLLAQDFHRQTVILANDSTATAYVRYGTGAATATDYTLFILSNTEVSIPAEDGCGNPMTVIWAAANGGMQVTVMK